MTPIRLSVTMLDTYVSGMQNDEVTSEELAQQLFGEFKQSPAMAAGTAFHNILENGLIQLIQDNYKFTLPNDLNGTLELGSVRERKYEWEILPGVVLVGKIDAETAFKVIDHKLTAQFDQDRYMDSLQWRAYLAMRKKCHFAYQVFEHAGLPAVPNEHGLYEILIKKYHVLEQFAYKGMAEEVREVAYDLAEFARVWKPIVRNEMAQA
ncbi:hypothetical protein [Alkanindiges illinoisensis]|uniref:hypothetical protein n=1 Tax=Alkanindiges illinoisensis TaxID=197183 RepID=UPI000479CDFD|nr:hypothetical protein [Alkanindiges illinoisensis]